MKETPDEAASSIMHDHPTGEALVWSRLAGPWGIQPVVAQVWRGRYR